jgi:nitrite reductase (NADH) small subunit
MAFARIAKISEIPVGSITEFSVQGKTIAVANVGGKLYAINNTCLHRGGPLGQGSLTGAVVTCPWHGWGFDVTSGRLSHNQSAGVSCYRVEVRGDDVFVEIAGAS